MSNRDLGVEFHHPKCLLDLKGRKHIGAFGPGFFAVTAIILLGQILIVNGCSVFFEVAPLSVQDWMYIILGTSVILIVPDIFRFIRSLVRNHSK